MKKSEILASVRSIADELSVRGTQAGKIGAGTQRRIAKLFNPPNPLITWIESEREVTENGQRLPTVRGEVLLAINAYLMAAGYGAKCHTTEDREQAIARAASTLPGLCDKLEGGKVACVSTNAGRVPTSLERDTYYTYSAVEAYLQMKHDVSKVGQKDIHTAAKTLLDNEIDRETYGISEDYSIPRKFDAFIRAYRRARELLSAS